ncbi:MAG: hypothetical protein RMI51_05040 [Aquificaceae bacterium]|nr:hypothetical protein [Aquificaceae bacterium]
MDWLNYRHKLTDQPVEGGYLVLYTTSGTNPCACVIEKDKRFIADTTTYYALMRSKEEALYVASLLNSRVLANMISNNQARGAFGERHIHTLPLQHIPPFNPQNPLHLKLVEVAKKAHEKAGRPEIKEWLKGVHFNRIRTLGRHILYFELNKIDAIVAKLLG